MKSKHLLYMAALVGGTICVGQTAPKPKVSSPSPTFKANSRVVVLDVVVTDKSGNPITDLKEGDLTVIEQGVPQTLRSFELMNPATIKKSAIPPLVPGGVYYNGPEGKDQPSEIAVLLLDALNTSFNSQTSGRLKLLQYVDRNNKQPMAVFGLTDSLLLLQSFTSDPGTLHRVIARKGMKQTTLSPTDNPIVGDVIATSTVSAENVDRTISKAPDLTQPANIDGAGANHYFEDFPAMQANNRVVITLEALKSVGHWLSGYPGRKKLIWVAGSFPVQLNPNPQYQFSAQNSYLDEVKETATVLTDAQVSVYLIDANGLVNEEPVFAAEKTGREDGKNVRSGADLVKSLQEANSPVALLHATMNTFATQTGGRAFYGSNNMDESLAQSIADGRVYYAISYSPENKKWDGNYRRLQVKTKRSGLVLQYRRGYYALDPRRAATQKSAKITDEMNSALESPLLATGLRFYGSAQPATTEPAPNAPAGFTRGSATEVRFMVNTKDVLFESKEERHRCSVRYLVGVYRGEELMNTVDQTMTCDAKTETVDSLHKDGMLLHSELAVPDGKLRLRLVVRDNLTGKIGSVDIPYPLEVAAK